jgi:hypothetical protein
MAQSIKDVNNTFNERFKRLSETLRLAIIISIFWPIFSFIYIVEPHEFFILSEFIRKFALMGVLPLVFFWGTRWVVQGLKKGKA